MTDQKNPYLGPTLAANSSYIVSGDGPPVVLVHGMGLKLEMWRGQVEAMETAFTVVRYDLLGHGGSPGRPGVYELQDFVDQLSRLLAHLDIECCALVGFSLGGLIAQAFALAHPRQVARLAILNAGFDRSEAERAGMLERLRIAREDGHGATVETALERWFTPVFAARRGEVVEQVGKWMWANDRDTYAEIYRVLAHGDKELADRLPGISCPTLVLTCEDDSGSPPHMAQAMARAIPNAELAIVPRLRHMGLLEDPGAINKILLPFLTS